MRRMILSLVVAGVLALPATTVAAFGACEETRDLAIGEAMRELNECRNSWWNIFDGSGCGFQYLFTLRDINRDYQSCKADERSGAMRDPTGK